MSNQSQRDSLLRILLVVLAIIVLVPLLMMAFSVPMMGWWSGAGSMMSVSPIWGLGLLLLILAIVLAVGYVLYRGLAGGQTRDSDPALDELRSAYARGDLTYEEFDQRRERLQRDHE